MNLDPTVARPRCNSPINRFCILATQPPPPSRGRLLRAMIDTVKYGVLHERRDAGVALSTYRWGPLNPACGFTDVRVREKAAAETRHLSARPASVGDISFDHRDKRRSGRLISMPMTRNSYIIRATSRFARSGNDLITGTLRQMRDRDCGRALILLVAFGEVSCCTYRNLRGLEIYEEMFRSVTITVRDVVFHCKFLHVRPTPKRVERLNNDVNCDRQPRGISRDNA